MSEDEVKKLSPSPSFEPTGSVTRTRPSMGFAVGEISAAAAAAASASRATNGDGTGLRVSTMLRPPPAVNEDADADPEPSSAIFLIRFWFHPRRFGRIFSLQKILRKLLYIKSLKPVHIITGSMETLYLLHIIKAD